jgi:hypothetical protein
MELKFRFFNLSLQLVTFNFSSYGNFSITARIPLGYEDTPIFNLLFALLSLDKTGVADANFFVLVAVHIDFVWRAIAANKTAATTAMVLPAEELVEIFVT